MTADNREVKKLSADLRALGPKAAKNVRVAIQKTCADTKSDAQLLVPVDTGALRSSITYETRFTRFGATGEVGPTQDYGGYVELGTSHMGPQPYMRPAFDRRAPILEQILAAMHTGELT